MDLILAIAIIYLTSGVLLVLIGFLIFRENPSHYIHRATAVMLLLAALAPIMGAFGILLQRLNVTVSLDLELFKRIFLVWEFFFPQLLYFSLIFPRRWPFLDDYPRAIYFLYLPHFFHFIVVLIFRSPESLTSFASLITGSQLYSLLKPFMIVINISLGALSIFYEFHVNFFALINLIYVIVAIVIMHRGFRNLTSPRLKRQVALVLWGIRVSVGCYAIAFLLPKLFPLHASDIVIHFLTIFALLVGACSIAWAIIKYQFLDISQSISQGFLFSICTGLVIGIYLIAYEQAKGLFAQLIGLRLPVVEVIFIVFAIILLQPLLSGINRYLSQLFDRDKTDYQNVLQTLSHDILTMMDLESLRDKISSTLTNSLHLENVHLIIENKAGDFEVCCDADGTASPICFDHRGGVVNMLRQLKRSAGSDEIIAQLPPSSETEMLNRLNCYLMMPLIHRDHLNGILCLGNKHTRTSLSSEDAALLNVLSSQISIAIENIVLYQEKLAKQQIEKELSLAREIQRMLLPDHIPQGAGYEISALNIPSTEVGGDYYDFIQLDENHLGIAIGDISGKGIPGAILMSNLQATLRSAAYQSLDSAQVMQKINQQISRTTSPEKFATFFYGILDTNRRQFLFTNAGHNYPIYKKQTGQFCHLSEGGLIIGVKPDFDYRQTCLQLESGDWLVFYTDGITEAMNPAGDPFGESQLLDIILNHQHQTAEDLRNMIYDELVAFTQGHSQYDDVTLIVLRII
ncbi:MAG: SpoIIE family protein phosphatase [candidate division KSB1 bacterium]|nr:SpoIIE family protein phosphatase [candidate division KSB1 bacterium]